MKRSALKVLILKCWRNLWKGFNMVSISPCYWKPYFHQSTPQFASAFLVRYQPAVASILPVKGSCNNIHILKVWALAWRPYMLMHRFLVVWLSLIFEVLQELLILPLYFTFGKTINDDTKTANKIKTGLLSILFIFTFLSILLYFLLPDLVKFMAQNKDLQNQTID